MAVTKMLKQQNILMDGMLEGGVGSAIGGVDPLRGVIVFSRMGELGETCGVELLGLGVDRKGQLM